MDSGTQMKLTFVALAAIGLVGCGEAPGESVAETELALVAGNGLHVNGLHVNGLHVNGTSLAGFGVAGMTLEATHFSGSLGSTDLAGLDFIGARMTAVLPDGSVVELRIDDIEPSSDPDLLLYDVAVSKDGVSWSPLCTGLDGASVRAYPLNGYWDESQGTPTGGDHVDDPTEFTFACQGYALSKCVDMGYRPWESLLECKSPGHCHTIPLSYHHQACTRMLRADYCGNGTPATQNGTPIDISDNVGLESTSMPEWPFEAEWSPRGATCVESTRWKKMADPDGGKPIKVKKYIQEHCPERWVDPEDDTCDEPSSSFYTANGYGVPLEKRSLLKTRIAP